MTQSVSPILNEKVAVALKTQPFLRGKDLRFETEEGRVVLKGRVGSYYHKLMVQEAIRRVDGVDQIDNELEVTWT